MMLISWSFVLFRPAAAQRSDQSATDITSEGRYQTQRAHNHEPRSFDLSRATSILRHHTMKIASINTISFTAMFASNIARSAAFLSSRTAVRSISSTAVNFAKDGQAEVVLVGCGAPNRGMGWYHAVQMLEEK